MGINFLLIFFNQAMILVESVLDNEKMALSWFKNNKSLQRDIVYFAEE